ncbi:MAG TPA: iron-sulfur cluster assembly scaffold protein, partial [Lentisphaeria bacterium]|nr:iron-sulfur cluster assembly scaffold protein [Lentisphaeria bacterium]
MAWKYSKKLMDYFLHPRNVGEIKDADGVGEIGNIVCGDAMKLFLKMSPDRQTIADVKFQTFGCASAIASTSALTEMLIGKTLAEALTFRNQDIADYLGDLPEEKMHCSVMGVEAFQAALIDMKKRHPDWDVPEVVVGEGEDRIVCHCFEVTEG